MVYPVFEEKSIQARCLEDIKQFICICQMKDKYGEYVDMETDDMKDEFNNCLKSITDITPELTGVNASLQLDGLDTKSDLDTCINKLKNAIIEILGDNIKYEVFDYSHDIASLDSDKQRKLWILRTYVFYQLLIFATIIMKSETLFKEIYNTSESKYKRVWRSDVTENELLDFKMGIFGSLTPTSDIDIGISYTGKTGGFSALAYVVAIFEDMFKIFMKKSSLQLDIEPYADMYILPNPNNDLENPYIFYLDTSKFDQDDFKQILPYVKTSILRNYVFAKLQLEHDSMIDTTTHVNNIVTDFKNKGWDNTISFFKTHILSAGYKNDATKYYVFNRLFDSSVELLKQNDPIDHDSTDMILSYMSKDYDTSREKYYKSVEDAENYLATEIKPKVLFNNEVLTKQMIINIMQKIGKTLTWRAESYTCGPTIMHVVRVLQANKNNPNKYKTNTPTCIYPKTDPMCALGPYGFIMSVMEQLGYIYRFNLTYKCDMCNQKKTRTAITKDCAKCIKKYTKYNERIQNAVEYIREPVIRNGGSRTTKKQKSKQTRHKRRDKQCDKHGGKRKTRKSKQ